MKRKNNTVIAILIACILIMSVGYAALASRLSINGTSRITSTWGVEIIGITSKATGEASNVLNTPTYTSTTATFNTNLVNPGDKIEYTITVKNTGTLDAIIESVNLEHDENQAINYIMDGIIRGYTLTSNETIDLKLTIEYDETVTTQPENLSASATLIINAVQLHNSDITPVKKPQLASTMLKDSVVTSGAGLYADSYEDGKYIYRGANPDNYIEFNNEVWRILSVESDGSIKIVRNEVVENKAFDEINSRPTSENTYCTTSSANGCNAWASTSNMTGIIDDNFTLYYPQGGTSGTPYSGTVTKDSSLNTYLNTIYYSNLLGEDKKYIINHDFNISTPGYAQSYWDTEITADGNDTGTNVSQEALHKWNGLVGLVTLTEYMRTTTDTRCTNIFYGWYSGYCSGDNWLRKSSSYWTISPVVHSDSNYVWVIGSPGNLVSNASAKNESGVLPVVYLTPDITLTGTGKNNETDIYRIA